MIGGSTAFGEGVAWRDAFPAVLAHDLVARGVAVEVLHAGVRGSSIRQGVERWRALVREYDPDVVIGAWAGESESRAAPGCVTDDEQIALGLAGADARVSALDPRALSRVVQSLAWLGDVLGGSWWPERDRDLRAARLASSAGSWDAAGTRRVPLLDFQSSIVTLAIETRAAGAALILLAPPRPPALRGSAPVLDVYARVLENTAAAENVPLVSGDLALARAGEQGIRSEDFFVAHDGAPGAALSACGHSIVAAALADEIVARRSAPGRGK